MTWKRTILIALTGEISTNIGGGNATVPYYTVVGTHETTYRHSGPPNDELERAVLELINDGTITAEEAERVVFLQELDSEIEISRAVSVMTPMREAPPDEAGD